MSPPACLGTTPPLRRHPRRQWRAGAPCVAVAAALARAQRTARQASAALGGAALRGRSTAAAASPARAACCETAAVLNTPYYSANSGGSAQRQRARNATRIGPPAPVHPSCCTAAPRRCEHCAACSARAEGRLPRRRRRQMSVLLPSHAGVARRAAPRVAADRAGCVARAGALHTRHRAAVPPQRRATPAIGNATETRADPRRLCRPASPLATCFAGLRAAPGAAPVQSAHRRARRRRLTKPC